MKKFSRHFIIRFFQCSLIFALIVIPPVPIEPQAQIAIPVPPAPLEPLPPILNPIGNKTVALGRTLRIELSAQDPNNDPLYYSAQPVPLPANATLETTNPQRGEGIFNFHPVANQVGQVQIRFIVNDGTFTDDETITINVTGPGAGSVTELSGRLLDTNDFVRIPPVMTPIVGARISLLGTAYSTLSDSQGNFLLTAPAGIPSGHQILDIDATNAQPGPQQ